ncbi:AI-2E family transporter [Merismopedia glauca]|uniref:AI-2E family transporter n=2 Tax=Merismopedia TaxID=53402 RepID=A0A2T1C9J0_9CYAN|nr:AI-2E family transporter [Merismopedia glauca]PSB04909.1 AI-2E family transporter [Merismopedia glauca CCAP 1448/3]
MIKTSISRWPRWLVVGLAFPLAVLNFWLFLIVFKYLQPLVSVFIIATLLAFILEYPVDLLQKTGLKRTFAVILVFLLTIFILATLGIVLLPIIWAQLNELYNRLPSWISSGVAQLQALNEWAVDRNFPIDLSGLVNQLAERLSGQLQTFTSKVVNIALDTIGSAANVVLTVVLTFYLVLNGARIWDGVFEWFPQKSGSIIRRSLRHNFHNYFVGQAILAVVVGSLLTTVFLLLRIPLGLLFGLGIGFLALFPFGTAIGISLVSTLVALQNFWLGVEVLSVGVILEQINGNLIGPRILGEFTGLNPVWIFLSLLLGAKVAGLLGVLIAVPLASFIKTIALDLRDGELNLEVSSQQFDPSASSEQRKLTNQSEIKS